MGDRLRAGKLPRYFTKPPTPTQPPTLRGTGNEYRVTGHFGPKTLQYQDTSAPRHLGIVRGHFGTTAERR